MNVFPLWSRLRDRMQELFDSERVGSGLTAINGPSPMRPPERR